MKNNLENIAMQITKNIGSIYSIIIHTLIFIFFFVLILIGYNPEKVMLVLTTLVSLEAIYLSLFIQMTVNKNTESISHIEEDIEHIEEDIEEIAEDVEEVQEDIEGIAEDVEEMSNDIDELQEDIDEIAEDIDEINNEDKN